MQREFAVFVDDGVTGIAAALITHDQIVIVRQQIDHAALAFITPVDADNCTVAHDDSSFLKI